MGRPEFIKAVLFDMDGTVVDSEDIKNRQLADLLSSYGATVDADALAFVSGMDLEGLLAALQSILDAQGVKADAWSVLKSMPYGREEAYLHPDCKPVDGVIDFLADLKRQGIATALVSNTPAYAVLFALNRFGMLPLFDCVIGGDMIAKHKPDPEGYLLAMGILGVEPASCIVIEDSTSGIVSGAASGAYVCARDDGTGNHDFSSAHERFSSYAELHIGNAVC